MQRQLLLHQNESITCNSPHMPGANSATIQLNNKGHMCWEDVEDELLAVVVGVLGFEIDV